MKHKILNYITKGICSLVVIMLFASFGSLKDPECNYQQLYDEAVKKLKKFTLSKDYQIYLKKKKKKEAAETFKQIVTLNRGVRYKFYAIGNKEFEGNPVVSIYNNEKQEFLLATTYVEVMKKFYEEIEFECKTTGNYCIVFSFQDGKEGCAVGVSSYLK